MSDLITIELDSDAVEAGGVISGTIFLLADDERLSKANRLELRAEAKVHGSGNRESITIGPDWIPGPFRAGYSTRFELAMPPEGPITWSGRYVKIDWHLEVSLDISWAVDPKSKVTFRLVPRAAVGALRGTG